MISNGTIHNTIRLISGKGWSFIHQYQGSDQTPSSFALSDLFLAIPVSGRVVADGRSPSARPITCLPSLPWCKRGAYREVRHVIVGTRSVAVALLTEGSIWDPLGRGSHRNLAASDSYQQGGRIAP